MVAIRPGEEGEEINMYQVLICSFMLLLGSTWRKHTFHADEGRRIREIFRDTNVHAVFILGLYIEFFF